EQSVTADAEKLAVLWTSGDPFVAHKVCFMYTHNAKKAGWWNEVQLIVWGPSSKLLAEDKDLQTAVKAMMADGVVTKACKACADSYGVSDDLAALGIEVKYMGKPLTEMLKSDQWQVLTF
ncbi:MAG: DsrE family protein, partial [Planctomycetota bacterium]